MDRAVVSGREAVKKTLRFENPGRYAVNFPEPYGNDFTYAPIHNHPEHRPRRGCDAWGCVWECYENTSIGEVKDSPIKSWEDFGRLSIPDLAADEIWEPLKGACDAARGQYLLGSGVSLFTRYHYLRGLENTWCDVLTEPDNLRMLIKLLADMNLRLIERFAHYGVDGIMLADDWGLQDRLMVNPRDWRAYWLPEYERIIQAAHQMDMDFFIHSCGYIIDILGDWVRAGLDAIHMDQQQNMGLERLGALFKGKITFYAPVDIQHVMPTATPDEVRAYCRLMGRHLGIKEGGFIPTWYSDPKSVGHTQVNIEAMCEEFLIMSDELYA
jgi:uroporphyrinogen-III decarboxylase